MSFVDSFDVDILYASFGFLMALRLLTVFRVLSFVSPLNSNKGKFIVALRGIDYSRTLLVKVWFTSNPIKGLTVGFISLISL